MCEAQTHGKIAQENKVSDIKNTWIFWWAKKLLSWSTKQTEETIASTLDKNVADLFLDNKDQRTHFENLHNNEEKLKYLNGIITTVYAKKISNEYANSNIDKAKDLELEMGSYIAAAAQMIFGNPTKWEA